MRRKIIIGSFIAAALLLTSCLIVPVYRGYWIKNPTSMSVRIQSIEPYGYSYTLRPGYSQRITSYENPAFYADGVYYNNKLFSFLRPAEGTECILSPDCSALLIKNQTYKDIIISVPFEYRLFDMYGRVLYDQFEIPRGMMVYMSIPDSGNTFRSFYYYSKDNSSVRYDIKGTTAPIGRSKECIIRNLGNAWF